MKILKFLFTNLWGVLLLMQVLFISGILVVEGSSFIQFVCGSIWFFTFAGWTFFKFMSQVDVVSGTSGSGGKQYYDDPVPQDPIDTDKPL